MTALKAHVFRLHTFPTVTPKITLIHNPEFFGSTLIPFSVGKYQKQMEPAAMSSPSPLAMLGVKYRAPLLLTPPSAASIFGINAILRPRNALYFFERD